MLRLPLPSSFTKVLRLYTGRNEHEEQSQHLHADHWADLPIHPGCISNRKVCHREGWSSKGVGYLAQVRRSENGDYLTGLFRSAQRDRCKATARAAPHYRLPRFVRRTDATRVTRSLGIC